MKLKNKMLVTILVPVLLVIMTLSMVSYYYSKDLLIKENRENMKTLAEKYGSDIETVLSEKIAYVEISANTVEKSEFTDEVILNDLKYLTKNVKGSLGFFLGLTNKKFLDGTGWIPDAGFDPTVRDWFKEAVSSEDVIISPPYLNAMDHTMVVTISKKINRDHKVVGAIGSDVSMKELEDLVKSIQIEETGKAYLLDAKGNFMVHDSYTFADSIESVDKSSDKALSKRLLTGTDSVSRTIPMGM